MVEVNDLSLIEKQATSNRSRAGQTFIDRSLTLWRCDEAGDWCNARDCGKGGEVRNLDSALRQR